MRGVTFQAPGEVRVDDVPEPTLSSGADVIIKTEASGICGSDLHIYRGRVPVEQGFTLGHEYVGTVIEAGSDVKSVVEGDRVLGTYSTACGECFFCARGDFHQCDQSRVFGHGATLGSLQGAQADQLLVPNGDLILRKLPEGMADEIALFAGDVMGTAWHAVAETGVRKGSSVAVVGLGPVGLCAVQAARAAGAELVIAVDTVAERLEMASSFGAEPVHLTEEDPRTTVKARTEGRGVDASIDAVGHPDALELACRLTRKAGTVSATGAYTERVQVHMGIVWIKALTLKTGQANVIKHVDTVLDRIRTGALDPAPLVTHRMKLEEAAQAYEIYDQHQALKIVLRP
jgi:2-desacetyl-2-hydroxyethyl bacteriochlorophyllide A dehydrogenase